MTLQETIYRRRSVRSYTGIPVSDSDLETILSFFRNAKPLFPHISVQSRIVSKEQVRFYFPWKTSQLLAIFSETKPGYLENVGFLCQHFCRVSGLAPAGWVWGNCGMWASKWMGWNS